MCFYLQRSTQRKLSYEEMTEDYPRYPDIYDINQDPHLQISDNMVVVRIK